MGRLDDKIAAIRQQLAGLPEGNGHVRERVDLLNKLGWTIRDQGEWRQVLELADQAMDLAQRHAYKQGLCQAFRNSAFAHYMLADYKPALAEAFVAVRMAEELADEWDQANAISVVALVYWSLGNYDLALEEAFRTLRLAESSRDKSGLAWTYTMIGGIYQSVGDHQKSLDYNHRAHALFAGERNRLGEARALSGTGTVYQALGNAESARTCHRQALEIYREIENAIGEARALNDLGEICLEQGNPVEALELHRQSLRIREQQQSQQAQATSLLNIGRVHLATDKLEAAREALNRALSIAAKTGARPKESTAHRLLAEVCERSGDYREALEHQQKFHELREEVFSDEEATKLRNLQTSIEVERSERQAEIHRLRNVELKQKNEQLKQLLEELRITQAQLIQSEKTAALGDLVAAVAHEINTPLGVIQTAADISTRAAERVVEAIEGSKTVEELKSRRSVQATITALRKNGQMISEASARISAMIRNLKSFARLDQAAFQQFSVNDSVRDSLALLEPVIGGGIEVVSELTELPAIYGYPAELNQVVLNLLRNSCEAIEREGSITVTTYRENGLQCVSIADTGRGIPENQLPRLFNPGFTVAGSRVKASMSLFTSLNIVHRHRGEIQVESEPGKGSTFTVKLKGLDPVEESADASRL